MSRQIRCPNCGGEHELANPGITQLVCHYCKTVVYWGDDQVLKTGTQSILPEGDTRLYMYATGKLDGRDFQVVGHVRYDHGRGSWDEWYLQMGDGGVAWVSEDERKLEHEQATNAAGVLPYEQLSVGTQLMIGYPEKSQFSVRELGVATCIGGEGQTPFTILPGERYPYADLASYDGKQFATLEYDNDDGTATAFIGRTLDHSQLVLDAERPPSTAGSHAGKSITCSNCNGAIEIAGGREVETQVCAYCGAQLDLTGAEAQVMGVNPVNFDHGLIFEVGAKANLRGKPYEVAGRMLYIDPEGYRAREYLLWNPEAGYLWLAEENNHYVINEPTQLAPRVDPMRLSPKTPVMIGEQRFMMYESGSNRLQYVDGALPWLAKVGDNFGYADLIAPPKMFGVETDGTEVEYFMGQYVPHTEVWAAFGRDGVAPKPIGVHPAQPYRRGVVTKLLMLFGLIFALVNLGLLIWAMTKTPTRIFSQTFAAADYSGEALSNKFNITGHGKVMSMKVRAPLANSWIYVQIALINTAKHLAVTEVDAEISYYYGYSGGENWYEGSRTATVYFKAPPPGEYQIVLKGQGGSGNYKGPPRGEPMRIRLYQGHVLFRYFAIMFAFCALVPLVAWRRKKSFNRRRWAPVMGDDDDDDDDWD